MSTRRRVATLLALLTVIALAGCSRPRVPSPAPTLDAAADVARQRAQADAEFARWASLLDASPQGFFLVDRLGVGVLGQWDEPNSLCTLIGYPRTATAQLGAPLGQRAVLEVRTGQPVPVRPEF